MIKYIESNKELSKAIESSTQKNPLLVGFKAIWCGPCKTLAPILEQIASENTGKITVVFVDVDDVPESIEDHGVKSVPTIVSFKDGKEHKRFIGLGSKTKLLGLVE